MSDVTRIDLEESRPAHVWIRMSVAEAALVADLVGKESPASVSGKGHDPATLDVYEALAGEFFNRFWEDGVRGAIRGDEA